MDLGDLKKVKGLTILLSSTPHILAITMDRKKKSWVTAMSQIQRGTIVSPLKSH